MADTSGNPHPFKNNWLLSLALLVILGGLIGFHGETRAAYPRLSQLSLLNSAGRNLFLPAVYKADPFNAAAPIWPHDAAPAPTETALFRRTIHLDEAYEELKIEIFADTRYELWFDGEWLGRGPARFSQTLREYDRYTIPAAPGPHLIAVLVQWAPNTRRSESTRPHLLANIEGKNGSHNRRIAASDASWLSQLSPAWNAQAAPVHAWALIGPTELLDLRRLPAGWMEPAYDPAEWGSAAVVKTSANFSAGLPFLVQDAAGQAFRLPQAQARAASGKAEYRPRSIPFLVNTPAPLRLTETGLLSPGFAVGEIMPGQSDPFDLPVWAVGSQEITLELLLPEAGRPFPAVQVNGEALSWAEVGQERPDVQAARAVLHEGQNQIRFSGFAPAGLTFSISTKGVNFASFPFSQGSHAGRRSLLARIEPLQAAEPSWQGTIPEIRFKQSPAYAVLELERTVQGRLVFDMEGAAGSILDAGWDERLSPEAHRPLPYAGSTHPEWNQVDSWILDGTARELTTLDARAGKYILILYWGPGPAVLKNIRVYEEHFPYTQRGSFQSSSQLLNTAWQVGAATAAANLSDAYTDTPWRERGQWWGDVYVIEHVSRVAFGTPDLMKRALVFLADSYRPGYAPGLAPNPGSTNMIDYFMLWVQNLNDYTQISGDREALDRTYPVLLQFMEQLAGYENLQTGLLDLPKEHWSTTAYIETRGYHSRYGQSAAVNSLYFQTLQSAARLAEKIGDAEKAASWQQTSEKVRSSLNNQLYLPQQNRYLTHMYQGALFPPTPHAQAWPLAAGAAPAGQEGPLADSLLELIGSGAGQVSIDAYGMFWVLDGLGKAGRITEGIGLIEDYYGKMLEQGATTWWERFDANLHASASLSHGWSAAPTWFLSTYVLGARAEGPDLWSVMPCRDCLEEAQGILPLQAGDLNVAWGRRGCQGAELTVTAPSGTQGRVVIPWLGEDTRISLNGQVVWENSTALEANVTLHASGIEIGIHSEASYLSIVNFCSDTP